MIRTSVLFTALAALMLGSVAAPIKVQAQDLFAPRVIVNDHAVTGFEVRQRAQMLRLFRAPGDVEAEALKGLIEDRLRMAAAKELGIRATPDQVRAGMEEFAARANLSADQFVQALGQSGVSAETFRDFVEAGLVWREVIRQRFGPLATISEAEIDRAIASGAGGPALQALLSEIVLPAPKGQEAATRSLARRLAIQIKTEADFAAAARQYSASSTAGRGGQMDWTPLSNLPPAVSAIVLGLQPGQTSASVDLGEAVGLFQVRGIQEIKGGSAGGALVDYAQFSLPANATTASEVTRIRSKVDTCNDLYGIAKGLPQDRLTRDSKTMAQVPADIGQYLAGLDDNELTDFPRGGAHVVLMLCSRNPQGANTPARSVVRDQLVNQRLAAQAESYLEELRANAFIRTP